MYFDGSRRGCVYRACSEEKKPYGHVLSRGIRWNSRDRPLSATGKKKDTVDTKLRKGTGRVAQATTRSSADWSRTEDPLAVSGPTRVSSLVLGNLQGIIIIDISYSIIHHPSSLIIVDHHRRQIVHHRSIITIHRHHHRPIHIAHTTGARLAVARGENGECALYVAATSAWSPLDGVQGSFAIWSLLACWGTFERRGVSRLEYISRFRVYDRYRELTLSNSRWSRGFPEH